MVLRSATACAMVAALVHTVAASLANVKVDINTGMYYNVEDGTNLIFHGVNVVEKLPPYVPITDRWDQERSLGPKDITLLKSLGTNVIRLGVMMEAVVPTCDDNEEGIVDEEYLDKVADLIETLADNGIYTIVDAHQDSMSRYTCGEGFPDWYVKKMLKSVNFHNILKFPAPFFFKTVRDEHGYPNSESCFNHQFAFDSVTHEVQAMYKALYTHESIQDDFARSWGAVAKRMKNVPGVLGYELINEPWPLLPSRQNDKKTLSPLYKKLATAIREYDDERIVMFEPLPAGSFLQFTNKWGIPNFDVYGIEGEDYADRAAFAYHSYCPVPNATNACRIIIEGTWRTLAKELKRMKIGGFLTEFGSVGYDINDIAILERQTQRADELLQSWAYWTYKGYDDITTQNGDTETYFHEDGRLQSHKVRSLSKPYGRIIGGTPTFMLVGEATFDFHYTTTSPASSTNTEIYVGQTIPFTKREVLPDCAYEDTRAGSMITDAVVMVVNQQKCPPGTNVTVHLE